METLFFLTVLAGVGWVTYNEITLYLDMKDKLERFN